MSSVNKKGVLLSAAAAALLASAPVTVSAQEVDGATEGKCWGVNACKGHSSCKTVTNACKGQNSCKGQGFLVMSFDSCNESGGDFAEGE